jgi:hypothetical protein
MRWFTAKGPDAAALRQRKHELMRRFQIPDNLLPGSLVVTHRRCGKPTCHCAWGKGHPMWQLTFMVGGKKRVESIPADWADELGEMVDKGREFKNAVAEVLAINAQLLALFKRRKKTKRKKKKGEGSTHSS